MRVLRASRFASNSTREPSSIVDKLKSNRSYEDSRRKNLAILLARLRQIPLKLGEKTGERRFNDINIQMLSKNLHQQLFKDQEQHTLTPYTAERIKSELYRFGINVDNQGHFDDVKLKLPELLGENLAEHFRNIAEEQTKSYKSILWRLTGSIPSIPRKWLFQEGWTRYTESGAERVDYPLEDGLIFDVEVCVREGALPTLATAVSNKAWYGWVSKSLIETSKQVMQNNGYSPHMLIPLESVREENGKKLSLHQRKPKIVVGHNVSYDRARVKEQYWMNCTGTRFVDTMSLHICVSGINSYQRAVLKTAGKENENEEWKDSTSLNNLSDVHQLYCGSELDKTKRNIFVEGSLFEIKRNFEELMGYCASDVAATQRVFKELYSLFRHRFPHPVTLAGMLELSTTYLPVNSNWNRYLEEADSTFDDLTHQVKCNLSKRADEVCKLMHNDAYKRDLWMWDQDWSTQATKLKKLTKEVKDRIAEDKKKTGALAVTETKYLTDSEDEEEEDELEKKFSYLNETKYLLPSKRKHIPGYPAWYRKLCLKWNDENWEPGPVNISTSMQVVPKLLNLTWENYPLHFIKDLGWGFLVPFSDRANGKTDLPLAELVKFCPLAVSKEQRERFDEMGDYGKAVEPELHKVEFWRYKSKVNPIKNFYRGSGVWCNMELDGCCWFLKLPHKDGGSNNVGNPLAKDFLNKFSEHVLAGLDASATQVLKIARAVSYWRNSRDRITSQMVVWCDEDELPAKRRSRKRTKYGAILPQIVVCGTLTRRAVERTWMTASNAQSDRVGSELRAMIQAPPGYNIVGADVDSQELWIASLLGDAYSAKVHGATPFGSMTLIGSKANGSDMHSVTAKAVGISRDHAKVINYARIYGAGQKFAERLLKQFNPSLTDAQAAAKSRKMFTMTKGRRIHKLKKEFANSDLVSEPYETKNLFYLAKLYGKKPYEMFENGKWMDGSESAMFNRLEEIANSEKPVTPFLGSRLSRALENNDSENFLPTKINWVVQSGAVDFLHLMLVSMRWLMKDNARFCLSFHDEIRYIVPSRHKYNAALAMHITNLLTRSFCAQKLGINDLPMSVAFFSSVEVDTVLRKDSSQDCVTPSNPHGLEKGYQIPPGESIDIWKAIEKTQGSIEVKQIGDK